MAEYVNIPVDEETKAMVVALCKAYELPKRGQGAMVKKLVRADYEKLLAMKLVEPIDATVKAIDEQHERDPGERAGESGGGALDFGERAGLERG